MNENKKYMSRGDYCDAAKEIITTDRNKQYGEPEDNFGVIADFWTAYLSHKYGEHGRFIEVFAEDVAIMMTLFKIGRMVTAFEVKNDTFIDAIGYLACGAECAETVRLAAAIEAAARQSSEAMPEDSSDAAKFDEIFDSVNAGARKDDAQ